MSVRPCSYNGPRYRQSRVQDHPVAATMPGRKTATTEERFRAKFQVDPDTGCWNWQGWISHSGYGQFTVRTGEKDYAHRWAYKHWRESIPAGMVIDHVCENRACCNPLHLDVCTIGENLRRSTRTNANKTHCKWGHELTPDNVWIAKRGDRQCKACNREKRRAGGRPLRAP